jgi:hypothetical protein
LNIQEQKETHELAVTMVLEKYNNTLMIKNILIPQKPVLAQVLQNLVKKNMWTVATLYQYINENYAFYTDSAGELSICDIIRNKVGINYVLECSDTDIYLQKQAY